MRINRIKRGSELIQDRLAVCAFENIYRRAVDTNLGAQLMMMTLTGSDKHYVAAQHSVLSVTAPWSLLY